MYQHIKGFKTNFRIPNVICNQMPLYFTDGHYELGLVFVFRKMSALHIEQFEWKKKGDSPEEVCVPRVSY